MLEFKEGDIVQLKSGTGPTMTITSLDRAAGEAVCRWFRGRQSHEDIFDIITLELVHQQRPTHTNSSR
jgi:uncharacterized protein YodC (DUF2158 family)